MCSAARTFGSAFNSDEAKWGALETLEHINLGVNNITDDGALFLAQSIEMGIARRQTRPSGAEESKEVAEEVPPSIPLRLIELFGNPFSSEAPIDPTGELRESDEGETSGKGEQALQRLIDSGISLDIAWQGRVVGYDEDADWTQ